MTSKESSPETLRRKALEILKDQEKTPGKIPDKDLQKVIEEFRIHQIELELQNEELRRLHMDIQSLYSRYSQLFHQAPVGYLVLDEAGIIRQANDTFGRMVKISSAELKTRRFSDFMTPDDQRIFLSRYRAFFRVPFGKQMEIQIQSRDYRVFHAQIEGVHTPALETESGSGKKKHLLVTVSNISRQKHIENTLRYQQEQLTTTLKSIGDAVIITDVRGIITGMNPLAARLTQWSESEAAGHPLQEVFILRDSRNGRPLPDPVEPTLRKGATIHLDRHALLVSRHGREYQIADSISPIRMRDGSINGVVLVFRDATSEYRTQEELRFQSLILNQIRDLVTATDMDGVITYVNEAECKMFGKKKEELLGKSIQVFGSNPEKGPEQKDILEAARSRDYWRDKVVNRLPDGGEIILDCRIQKLRDEDGRPIGLLGISTDITEKEKLTEQIIRTGKFKAIGELSAGIAHDFNNMLTPILGYSDLMLREGHLKPGNAQRLREIQKAAQSAKNITRQLLIFARRGKLNMKETCLSRVVEGMKGLLDSSTHDDIRIEYPSLKPCRGVKIDTGQIEQVIMNLVINAQDAMPSGGTIRIDLSNETLSGNHSDCLPPCRPGSYIALSISDSGTGMDRETQSRIFEPFFSTKGKKGAGLGMAMVFGIIKQHKGSIRVKSRKGRGSTFTILLPRIHKKIPADDDGKTPLPETGNQQIMVVDDDPMVADMVCQVLSDSGYRVQAFSNPLKVPRKASDFHEPPELLLTDLIMPGINGIQLYQKIRQLFPEIQCLFMSGYSGDILAGRGLSQKDIPLLEKPFDASRLLTVVHQILNSPKKPRLPKD